MTAPSPALPDEPRLSPGFAARVMRRAEHEIARRRFIRRSLAGVGAMLMATALVPALRVAITPKPPGRTAEATRRTDIDPALTWSAGQREETGALVYLFPNAPPLMRFVDRYSAATYGISIDDESSAAASIEVSNGGF